MTRSLPEQSMHIEEQLEKGTVSGRAGPLWTTIGRVALVFLYTELVPRWFRTRRTQYADCRTLLGVASVVPGLKLGVGLCLLLLLVVFKVESHQEVMMAVSVYLVIDSLYQAYDLSRASCVRMNKTATAVIDFLTYPIYLIFLRESNQSRSRH